MRVTNSWSFPYCFPKMTLSPSQIKKEVYYLSTSLGNIELKIFVAKGIVFFLKSQVIRYRNIKAFFKNPITYPLISDIG